MLLAVVHMYPAAHNAGAEWMLHSILRWMKGRGHHVKVLVARGRAAEFQGVSVERLRGPISRREVASADVLLTHLDLTQKVMRAAATGRKPLVHLVHNDKQLEAHRVRSADAALVVFNSDWIRRKVRWVGPSMVLHPPVFADDYRTDPGNKVTLMNLSYAKGAETFWELVRREPRREFLGVRGAYGPQVIPDVLPPNVEVRGQTPNVKTVYADTRVLLMPSSYESFGRVAIEAACSGIPTIAAPTPGLQEALDYAGIFVDKHPVRHLKVTEVASKQDPGQGPVEAWQRALRELDDPDTYAEHGRLARKRADELEPTRGLEELERRLLSLPR